MIDLANLTGSWPFPPCECFDLERLNSDAFQSWIDCSMRTVKSNLMHPSIPLNIKL